jgi:hypothetical protein
MATKKLFKGTESRAEEMAEAKALRSGKISKAQYVAGEKSEGHTDMKDVRGNANAIASGRMSPAKYAAEERTERMKNGGMVKCYANGGIVTGPAPNVSCGTLGPGVRSMQDYKK